MITGGNPVGFGAICAMLSMFHTGFEFDAHIFGRVCHGVPWDGFEI